MTLKRETKPHINFLKECEGKAYLIYKLFQIYYIIITLYKILSDISILLYYMSNIKNVRSSKDQTFKTESQV